jgi:hypothetical protein
MGNGTSDGVQTPPQPGVITEEGENFPKIPEYLLKLSPDQIQEGIDRIVRAMESNRGSIFYNLEEEERLENAQALCEFAKIAVERQKASTERE